VPAETLKEILLTGKVTPWRASGLVNAVGRAADERDYLRLLLDEEEPRLLFLEGRAWLGQSRQTAYGSPACPMRTEPTR